MQNAEHRRAAEYGGISVFGRRAVLDAVAHADVETLVVRVARSLPAAYRKELTARCREASTPLELADAAAVHALSGQPRNDQGVAARIQLRRVLAIETFLAERKGRAARRPVRILGLDGVTNPQNVGMIVRSAVAAGIDGLLWPKAGTPWVSGLVIKASAAALYSCPILRCDTLPEGLHLLRRAGFQVAGLAGDATSSLFEYAPPHRAAFVVGGEVAGLSDDVRAVLDCTLAVPLEAGVESLNVAVAASFACFHAMERFHPTERFTHARTPKRLPDS